MSLDPSVAMSGLVAQLIALPAGKAMERILPIRTFNTFGYEWSLNPGPFNIKEHCLVTVMANVVAGGAYATDIIATQKTFYEQDWGILYQLLLVISTQILGFSLAGVCRQFLVWPASMIWPSTLVNTALFNTLHSTYGEESDDGYMTRERFFTIALFASFFWYFLPGYLFSALSAFNFICWMAPQNHVVNTLFGYHSGLGMGVLTFDWAMIAFVGSPLVTPVSRESDPSFAMSDRTLTLQWWAEVNVLASLVIVYWIIAPLLYCMSIFFAETRDLYLLAQRQQCIFLSIYANSLYNLL